MKKKKCGRGAAGSLGLKVNMKQNEETEVVVVFARGTRFMVKKSAVERNSTCSMYKMSE